MSTCVQQKPGAGVASRPTKLPSQHRARGGRPGGASTTPSPAGASSGSSAGRTPHTPPNKGSAARTPGESTPGASTPGASMQGANSPGAGTSSTLLKMPNCPTAECSTSNEVSTGVVTGPSGTDQPNAALAPSATEPLQPHLEQPQGAWREAVLDTMNKDLMVAKAQPAGKVPAGTAGKVKGSSTGAKSRGGVALRNVNGSSTNAKPHPANSLATRKGGGVCESARHNAPPALASKGTSANNLPTKETGPRSHPRPGPSTAPGNARYVTSQNNSASTGSTSHPRPGPSSSTGNPKSATSRAPSQHNPPSASTCSRSNPRPGPSTAPGNPRCATSTAPSQHNPASTGFTLKAERSSSGAKGKTQPAKKPSSPREVKKHQMKHGKMAVNLAQPQMGPAQQQQQQQKKATAKGDVCKETGADARPHSSHLRKTKPKPATLDKEDYQSRSSSGSSRVSSPRSAGSGLKMPMTRKAGARGGAGESVAKENDAVFAKCTSMRIAAMKKERQVDVDLDCETESVISLLSHVAVKGSRTPSIADFDLSPNEFGPEDLYSGTNQPHSADRPDGVRLAATYEAVEFPVAEEHNDVIVPVFDAIFTVPNNDTKNR